MSDSSSTKVEQHDITLINSKALFDPILERLAGGFLEYKDWTHFLQSCKTLKTAGEHHTTFEVFIHDDNEMDDNEIDNNDDSTSPITTQPQTPQRRRGRSVTLFKWGQATENDYRLYISLPNSNNISRSFGWKGDTTGETRWYKIRFCPKRRMVHTGDYTFAKMGTNNTERNRGRADWEAGVNANVPDLGDLAPKQVVNVGEYTPYATCFDCSSPGSNRAVSNIDLRGTPFAVESRFVTCGYVAKGSWDYSCDDQCVNLTGGGYCGMTVSKDFPGSADDHPGTWSLKLKLM